MKRYKKIILIVLIIFIVFLTLVYRKQTIPVLGYHSFYKETNELIDKNDEYINNIEDFEKQMKYLKEHNYKTLTLDEFYCWKKNKCKFPRKSVVVTIDDGNLSNLMYAFDILKKYNINASVFYIGSHAKYGHGEVLGDKEKTIYDNMSLDQINKAKKDYPNIKFYSHSYNLHDKDITNYSLDEIKEDVKQMQKIEKFEYYAHPFGISDERIINVLKDNNYKLAFGFGPKKKFRKATKSDNDYDISRLNISSDMSFIKFVVRLNMPY